MTVTAGWPPRKDIPDTGTSVEQPRTSFLPIPRFVSIGPEAFVA